MRLLFDEVHEYEGLHRRPARCRLRAWHEPDQRPVILATELPDNPGASITNTAEIVYTVAATLAALAAGIGTVPDESPIFVEHYPGPSARDPARPDVGRGEEHFARVELDWDPRAGRYHRPRWGPISKPAVEELIGQTLAE